MAKTIEDLFVYLRHAFDLLIILLFIVNFSKFKAEKGLIAIVCYCFIDLVITLTENYANVSDVAFVLLFAIFTFFEYLIFSYFLWLNIKNPKFRKSILYVSTAFIIFLIIYNATTKLVLNVDSVPIGIETILILIYSFYYFFEQMKDTTNLFIYNKYSFWIITGFMIYLSGSFFIYIFGSQIDEVVLEQYWFLTNVFYIIGTILFAI
jgi:hypothetical protein